MSRGQGNPVLNAIEPSELRKARAQVLTEDLSGILLAVIKAMALLPDDPDTALTALAGSLGTDILVFEDEEGSAPQETGTWFETGAAPLRLWVGDADLPEAVRAALGTFACAFAAARAREASRQTLAEQTLARLQRRELLLRNIFDLSPIGVMLIEEETGRIAEANTAFLGFGGWKRCEVIGQDIRVLLPEPDRIVHAKAVAEMETSSRFGPIEHAFQRPDGGIFPAIARGLQIESGEGKRLIWVMVEDISAAHAHLAQIRAAHDEAIRARAELDTAVQALPHGFVLFDAQDRVVLVNDQMHAVYPELASFFVVGRTYEDILLAATAKGVFPEALGREDAFIEEILKARRAPSYERLTGLNGGRLMRVLERSTPNGGRVGLRIDVTEEHDAARRLGDVIEGSQAGTWEVDLATGENTVNDRWAEMLGLRSEDLGLITSETWVSMIHPEDRAEVLGSVTRLIRGDQVQYEHTYRMAGANGRWVWINDRGRVSAWAPDGTPARMAGVHLDISALKEAEERLEHIIQGAEAGTWQFNVKTGANIINARWAEMIGYDLAELKPMTHACWRALVHPEDYAALSSAQDKLFVAKEWLFNYELRLRHKAGHWVWVQSRGQVTEWDEAGVPILMSGVHIDVSARKKLEEDLKVERDFLATLTDTSVSGIMAVDSAARILFVNRETLAIFETSGEALLGHLCDPEILGISNHAGQAMTLSDMPCRLATAAGRTLRDIRLRLAMKDGRTKVVSVNAAPLSDTGIEAQVVCTITDITAAAEAEDQLRAAMDRAEAANRAKSQFLANMSHELRTPLNGVLGMADLLAEGDIGDQGRMMVQTIRESGTLLLSIVNDILDLAKIESGKLVLTDDVFSFADLAQRIMAMHGLSAKTKGIGLALELGEGMDAPRRGDAQRLLQVMHNLVGNAVKFTEKGAVDLRLSAQDDAISISVCDTGIGMTPEQSAIVFDEFTQGDGSITRRFGGTGLGLPIVRHLVALMGGDIDLTSHADQGTQVNVQLRCPRAEIEVASPPPAVRLDFTGLRALVAEDNATNRVILRAMLGRLGIKATMVLDGDEAVLAYAAGRYDVLLLDISMPRKDGMTALAEIRAGSQNALLPPAIAVTANAMTHLVEGYRAAGFADVVAKPLQLDALAAAIAKVCPVTAV